MRHGLTCTQLEESVHVLARFFEQFVVFTAQRRVPREFCASDTFEFGARRDPRHRKVNALSRTAATTARITLLESEARRVDDDGDDDVPAP